MKKFVYYFSIFSFWFVLLSCSDEKEINTDATSVNLQFSYTKNAAGVDKFVEDIRKINIYVFDSKSCFVEEYIVNTNEMNGNALNLELDPGDYDFIVWGNLTESYQMCSMKKGITNFEECHLSISCNDDVLNVHPTPLYHGAVYKVKVSPEVQKSSVNIDMIKNTMSVRVTVDGLDIENADCSPYNCAITSLSKSYRFDNSPMGDKKLNYYPGVRLNKDRQLTTDLVIMRSMNDHLKESRMVFTKNDTNGQTQELINSSFYDMLIPASINGDLEIKDSIEIMIHH